MRKKKKDPRWIADPIIELLAIKLYELDGPEIKDWRGYPAKYKEEYRQKARGLRRAYEADEPK